MVNAVSAVVFAAVAFNAASTLAMPPNVESADLMEREFDDFDLEAREFYDFDERDFYDIDEFEARELLEDLDARYLEDEGMDAREVDEVFQYLRAVSTSTTSTSTHHHHHATKTVTHTHTHTPRPTACTKKELKQHERDAKKAKEAAKKAKAIADKKKKADEKAAKKAKKDAEFKAKMAKKYGLIVPTTTTSSSATATHTTSTTAAASHITPAPVLKAIPGKLSLHTVTHFGTVTVKVTTTAARPQCTKGHHHGLFSKLFRNKNRSLGGDDIEEMMSRELEVDQLD